MPNRVAIHEKGVPHSREILISVILILAVVGYSWLFSGDLLCSARSPDGRYIAEWREFQRHSATTSNLFVVGIRRRFSPIRHTLLTGDFVDRPSIAWLDAQNLLVKCSNCGTFEVMCDGCQFSYVYRKETRWHDVVIHYGKW